jgi:signal peptidase I
VTPEDQQPPKRLSPWLGELVVWFKTLASAGIYATLIVTVLVNDVALPDSFVAPEFRSHDDYGPFTVPTAYYFVLGDHRNNSSDSRNWGPVPKKYIVGKVQLRWWPVPAARVF